MDPELDSFRLSVSWIFDPLNNHVTCLAVSQISHSKVWDSDVFTSVFEMLLLVMTGATNISNIIEDIKKILLVVKVSKNVCLLSNNSLLWSP
jgi:hypothetical protein